MLQVESALIQAELRLVRAQQHGLRPSQYLDVFDRLCAVAPGKSVFDAYGVKVVLGVDLVRTMHLYSLLRRLLAQVFFIRCLFRVAPISFCCSKHYFGCPVVVSSAVRVLVYWSRTRWI